MTLALLASHSQQLSGFLNHPTSGERGIGILFGIFCVFMALRSSRENRRR